MTGPTRPPTRVLGCDVGKAQIVVHDTRHGTTHAVPNTRAALEAALADLDGTCLLVCEATGGYEALLLATALAAGCPAHRADARKVKAFIRSFGTLGKTDSIDARALARYGQERHDRLSRWQAPDPARTTLQTLVLTRRDLVAQHLATRNRRDAPGAAAVAAYLNTLLDCLAAQIAAIEAEIDATIAAQATLHSAAAILQSIPGVGARTAAALLALMPELGTLNRRQAAALAGLAPHPNQSGERERTRRLKGGRPEIKRLLFMAAMAAARHHPTLGPAYAKLVATGKKRIVALTALMRRIIVIANAKLRTPQQQGHVQPTN